MAGKGPGSKPRPHVQSAEGLKTDRALEERIAKLEKENEELRERLERLETTGEIPM